MEGMEFLSTTVESLSERKILFVYCIDTAAKSSSKFDAVPCFRFNYVLGHCGFPDMLRRRFIVLFVDSKKTRDSFDGMTSPAVIKIKSSCLIKVDHTREYALITEFSVLDSLISATVMKPEDPDDGETPIPNLPWLNIAHCKCNCSNFPERGQVLVNRDDGDIYNTALNACSGDGNDSTVNDSSEEDMVLYAERFKLRGSTFHNIFQLALKKCQQKRANKEEIACKLQVQPVNIKDENAIVAQAYLDDRWQSLGYIPKEKIPKLSKAILAEEVQEVKLEFLLVIAISTNTLAILL